jgi:hypothetical protein
VRRGSGGPVTRSAFPVLVARWAEDVEHAGSLGPGAQSVSYAARRAPEIARFHRVFLSILSSHTAALQHHAPLLLGMTVDASFRIRRDRNHRKHGLITDEDACRQARGKLAVNADARIFEIEKASFVTHCFFHCVRFAKFPTFRKPLARYRSHLSPGVTRSVTLYARPGVRKVLGGVLNVVEWEHGFGIRTPIILLENGRVDFLYQQNSYLRRFPQTSHGPIHPLLTGLIELSQINLHTPLPQDNCG